MACVPLGLLAYEEEIPRLTLRSWWTRFKAELELTQKIKSYNGKEVEIQGFIIPPARPDLSFFLLSRVLPMGNYCCEVPVGAGRNSLRVYGERVKIFYDPLRGL